MKTQYTIKQAAGSDITAIVSLLKTNSLPTEDIDFNRQQFWIAEMDQQLLGSIAIENYKPFGFIRSLAVHPSFRGQKIGSGLLLHAVSQAENLEIEQLYLMTDSASKFFERQGWIHIRRESIPDEVQQSGQFGMKCCNSTACMYLALKEGHVKTALKQFNDGFNCAQSVFSAFAPSYGLDSIDALKITSGFGAGICYKGEVCGAVSGAYMALGLKYGRWRPEDEEAKEKTYSLMREFDQQFLCRNDSLYCNKLLGGDISTGEGRKQIIQDGKFKTLCPRYVKDAVEIAETLMEDV